MARLGYLGFTVTLTKRADGNERDVLVWAGGGSEAITRSQLYNDLDRLVDTMQEDDKFMHFTEVWQGGQ